MKRLIYLFITLTICFLAWYFLLPERWILAIANTVENKSVTRKPDIVIPDSLFLPGAEVVDAEGNVFGTVKINGVSWLDANARVKNCYSDSTVMDFADGGENGPHVALYSLSPRYGYYAGDKDKSYGVLYTYAAVRDCNLCPQGFRVATKADWEHLFSALGTAPDRGKFLMKKYGSPFAANLGGRADSYGSVLGGQYGFWWASDRIPTKSNNPIAWAPELRLNGEVYFREQPQRTAHYVRCVRE